MKSQTPLLLSILLMASGSINAADVTPYGSNGQQQVMLTPEQEIELNQRAASEALRSVGMAPSLIRPANRRLEEIDKARYEILKPPSVQRVNKIRVGETNRDMHRINVYPNQATTITIVDSMGEPWPLSANPIIASDTYVVSYNAALPGFLTIETKAKHVPSSLVLALKDRLRPLQFQLRSNNTALDYAVEITIEGRSPLNSTRASRPYGGMAIPSLDSRSLGQFLIEPPREARQVRIIGHSLVEAWQWNGLLIVKSPFQLVDPANPIRVERGMDSSETIYALNSETAVFAFLDERSMSVIDIEVLGD